MGGRIWGIGADFFADSQIHSDNKEAKFLGGPVSFGDENELKYPSPVFLQRLRVKTVSLKGNRDLP
jgi:hypothetical protein